MKYLGVDGCPDGWLAVEYAGEEFRSADQFDDIQSLWNRHDDAEMILIDVPIGLREDDNTPRPCDAAARDVLGSPRGRSVFPTPVRGVLDAESYQEAREIQEDKTEGSLGAQTWGISNKIAELDTFLRGNEYEGDRIIREAHPEVCFWALNGKEATEYSKTGMPVAAFWERIEILESVDENVLGDIRTAGLGLQSKATNDDIVDAFALALTASSQTPSVETLPKDRPSGDEGDPRSLPMEMVFSIC